jgi:hypothetical protein
METTKSQPFNVYFLRKKMKNRIILPIIFGMFSFILSANDDIFNAMNDEMQRSLKELKMEDLQKPYFIEYTLLLRYNNQIEGSLGKISASKINQREAVLTVSVRVGDYKFDQRNFFDVGLGLFGSTDEEESYQLRRIPIEIDYPTLRRELWLATDAAYKESAELFSKKQAALKNQIRKDTLWDFAKDKVNQLVDTIKLPEFDAKYGEELVSEITKIFLEYKNINKSRASYYFQPNTIYYMNSEGTKFIKNELVSGVEVAAFTQAEDGMPLYNFYVALGNVPSDIPSQDSILNATRQIAETLNRTLSATVLDDSYSGPVLLIGQAATQAFAQNYLQNLISQREPLQADGFSLSLSGASGTRQFQTKIGGKVLPEFMSMTDLPTQKQYGKNKLLAEYKIDDEGVLPQDVVLVKNGFLQTLLADRTPIKRISQSNGHKRAGLPMYTNVKIDADAKYKLDEKNLKKEFLKLCKQRDLPFGIMIKKVADDNIARTVIYGLSNGTTEYPRTGNGTLQPIEVYKVYQDGREELIRGGYLAGITPASFKDIIKCGNTDYVLNLLALPPMSLLSMMSSGEKLVTIIGQDLLFEDAEYQVVNKNFKKPPYLTNPLTEK